MPADLFSQPELYLCLKVGSDPEMTPRKRLASVGYSFKAENAHHFAGKDTSDFIQAGQDTSISTGMLKNGSVTTDKILPAVLSSLNGVSNDAGNLDLVAGSNIT